MLNTPTDVLMQFPIRKNEQQKESFRDGVCTYAESLGYAVNVEESKRKAKNIVIGDATNAKYLVTAHYDTPARMFLPNFITPRNFLIYILYQFLVVGILLAIAFAVGFAIYLPTGDDKLAFWGGYIAYFAVLLLMMKGPANPNNANDNTSGIVTLLSIAEALPPECRSQACFVLFDLEESGLVGSASYRKAHKNTTNEQIILNLDCVGDGDHIVMFPTAKLKKNASIMTELAKMTGQDGKKNIELHRKGFAFCPSDQRNFPLGVGIMAFKKWKGILYCDRIHTAKDTMLDTENVILIRDAVVSLLTDAKDN